MNMKRKRMRFSKQFIIQVIAELESGISRSEVCEKHGLNYFNIKEWISRYASEDYLKTRRRRTTALQRREIVRSVENGRMTLKEAALSNRIDQATVRGWIRQSKLDNPDIEINQSSMPTSTEQHLQKALEASQLKVLALETLIDVAEQEFKIKIIKKSGAKQS